MGELTEREDKLNFRLHEKSCANCRYYRQQKTGAITSECLLLGRTLGISDKAYELTKWDARRLCDGWKKLPKTWDIYSEGVESNPHWHDPYIKRETLISLRNKI